MKHLWMILLAAALGVMAPVHAKAAAPEFAIGVDGPTGPIVPGQVLVYHLRVTNLNPTPPAPALLVEANIPQFVGVNRPAGGKCAPKRCDSNYVGRFGNVVKAGGVKLAGTDSTVVVQRALRELDLSVSGTTRATPGSEVDYGLAAGDADSRQCLLALHAAGRHPCDGGSWQAARPARRCADGQADCCAEDHRETEVCGSVPVPRSAWLERGTEGADRS